MVAAVRAMAVAADRAAGWAEPAVMVASRVAMACAVATAAPKAVALEATVVAKVEAADPVAETREVLRAAAARLAAP